MKVSLLNNKGNNLSGTYINSELYAAYIITIQYIIIILKSNENYFLNYQLCVCARSCLTLCDPMDCSPPGSSVHGILQARIREWVAVPSSRESSRPRDRTCISCLQHWKADSIQLHHQFRYYHYSPRSKRLAYKRNI